MPMNSDYMSFADAQRILGVDAAVLTQWLAGAHITPFRRSRTMSGQLYRRTDIYRLATAHGITADDGQTGHYLLALPSAVNNQGPFDEHSAWLLMTGAQLANQRQKLLSGPHVLLAALSQQSFVGAIYGNPQFADLLTYFQSNQSNHRLEAQLSQWVDAPSMTGIDESTTFGLVYALTEARQRAKSQPISWYDLLRFIIQYDLDVQTTISQLATGYQARSVPANTYVPQAPSTYTTTPHLPSISRIGASAYIPVRYEPTASLRYAIRHHVAMSDLANALTSRNLGQVVVVRGLCGSPRERLEHVLADKLASPPDSPHSIVLAGRRHVMVQDVEGLHAAANNGEDEAVAALQECINDAAAAQSVLILSRGEGFSNPRYQTINSKLLGALNEPIDVPVLISYEDSTETEAEEPITLEYLDFKLVRMEPYTPENTINAIRDYYHGLLSSWHLRLDQGALNTAMTLESAICIPANGGPKRKVLPYSVADLVVNAAKKLLSESKEYGTVMALANTAADNAARLRSEKKQGRMLFTAVHRLEVIVQRHQDDQELAFDGNRLLEKWQPICRLLESVPDRMRAFADIAKRELPGQPGNDVPPSLSQDGSSDNELSPVTDDLVTAELFASQEYLLDLWGAFKRDVGESDPDLKRYLEGDE